MSPDARQLMAQHARTTELLGVDFLPLGTPPPGLIDAQPAQASQSAPPEITPEPAQHTPPRPATGSATPPAQQPPQTAGIPAIALAELRAQSEPLPDPQTRLDALRARYEREAPHQHFNTSFTNIVFGEGDANADLMFVGEAPGEQEDLTGRPFIGRAGQLLEKMIVAMGFSRESVYIANVLKTRPPNNATPTSEEARLCAPYLLEQIRVIEPKVIVTLGLPASHLLLGSTSPMRSLRGTFHPFPPQPSSTGIISQDTAGVFPPIAVMPTYHPAYLLRSYTEENRRKVWSDLQQVMTKLKPE